MSADALDPGLVAAPLMDSIRRFKPTTTAATMYDYYAMFTPNFELPAIVSDPDETLLKNRAARSPER